MLIPLLFSIIQIKASQGELQVAACGMNLRGTLTPENEEFNTMMDRLAAKRKELFNPVIRTAIDQKNMGLLLQQNPPMTIEIWTYSPKLQKGKWTLQPKQRCQTCCNQTFHNINATWNLSTASTKIHPPGSCSEYPALVSVLERLATQHSYEWPFIVESTHLGASEFEPDDETIRGLWRVSNLIAIAEIVNEKEIYAVGLLDCNLVLLAVGIIVLMKI